jgi:hypothetical protein
MGSHTVPGRKKGPVVSGDRGVLEDSWRVAQSRHPEVIAAHQKSLADPHVAETRYPARAGAARPDANASP